MTSNLDAISKPGSRYNDRKKLGGVVCDTFGVTQKTGVTYDVTWPFEECCSNFFSAIIYDA